MEERVITLLKEIGLGKTEIDSYLDLLTTKMSTAYETAKRTQQHRSNVYDALKRLQQRGFVTEVVEEGKRFFEAKQPQVIFDYIKQKESEIKDLLPLLESLKTKKTESNPVSVSYGITRARTILYSLMNREQDLLMWGVPSDIFSVFGEAFIKDIEGKRVRRKVLTKIIYFEKFHNIKKVAQQPYMQVKYIKSENPSTIAIVCADLVFLIVLSNPLMIVDMKGQEVADWFRTEFKLLWKNAEKPFLMKDIVVKKATALARKPKKWFKSLRKSLTRAYSIIPLFFI